MDESKTAGPNAQQIEYWNDAAGTRWVEMSDIIDAQIAPLGEVAMDNARIVPGERILDVGCGCGQTTIALAKRVGPQGSALGLDISDPMLVSARKRARDAGLSHVEFSKGDAQTHAFDAAGYDLLFSRFGAMFFASPVDAFTNLITALRPAGRLALVTWQELGANPWMMVPVMAALKHLPPGGAPPDPHAPGPFAFADRARVTEILRQSGFEDIQHESLERDLLIGGGRSLQDTVEFLTQLGPAAAALRAAEPDLRRTVMREVEAAIEPYHGPRGVQMPSATWIVSARRPS